MITVPEIVAAEVHPMEFVIVNVYVPEVRPEKTDVAPLADFVVPPVAVKVHVPDVGSPLSETLPVDTSQVGCVTIPTVGGAGKEFTVPLTAIF